MPHWNVLIERHSTETASIKVEANNENDAYEKAIEESYKINDDEWFLDDSEREVIDVTLSTTGFDTLEEKEA